ncbi:MAG: DNA recombination protein RmuC [Bacteroidaceae bacterium]|nr:DNA recombination protein RmuC [Bacteroidaceae bacterium]
MMVSVSDKVQVATDELLKKRQKEFEESSVTNLGQIVNPLKETIDKMKNAMADSAKEQTEMSSAMKENIRHLMEQTKATKSSADELAKALKHGTKVQGDWGETILDELLHSQGFTKGVHYDVQATMRDADGKTIHNATGGTMRPDVILHLDEQRDVVIDSKVSLTAFMDYVNAENEADRQRYLKQHVESLQKHVKELSVKDYSSYIASPKLKIDYVIMFVPHTGALWTALNEQPDLWRRAMDMNVFVADEQTLFAALRIINLTWTQIVQAQNHERVYALANEMLDRVGQFYERFQSIGAALDKAKVAYDDAGKKLEPSGQSIIQTGNKLKKLGAKQNDKHPIPEIISDGELS